MGFCFIFSICFVNCIFLDVSEGFEYVVVGNGLRKQLEV